VNMKNKFRKRTVALISLAVIVIIAIILAILLVPKLHKPSNPVAESLNLTQVGSTVAKTVTPTKLMSEMVVPATDKWWKVIQSYNNSLFLPATYVYGEKPTSIGYASVDDKASRSDEYIATPIIFFSYNSAAIATKAQQAFRAQTTESQLYIPYVVGKNLVLLPIGANPKTIFNMKGLTKATGSTVPTKGTWYINFSAWNTYMLSLQSAEYKKVYKTLSAQMGFNADAKEAGWWGTSATGTTWQGNMSATSGTPWSAANVKATAALKTLADTSKFVPIQPSTNGGNGGDTLGIVNQNQSVLTDDFSIASSTYASGSYPDLKTRDITATKKLKNPNVIKIVFNPNLFFTAMTVENASGTLGYVDYSQTTLTFNKKQPTSLTIDFK
jgi:hypothetical protein